MPTRKNRWLLAFLPFWWTGWTAGGIAVLVTAVMGDPVGGAFAAVWLVFWFVAWVFTAYAWLWTAFGKEVIFVDYESLQIKRDLFGRGPTRAFVLRDISRFRAAGLYGTPHTFERSMAPWGLTGGMIAFELDGKTRRFGLQLEEKEAHALVEKMRPYLPESAFERDRGIAHD